MSLTISDIQDDPRIGMIGSGSWATAMIKMFSDNRLAKTLNWWVRTDETADHIREFRHHPNYLSAVPIELSPEQIHTDAGWVVENSNIIILNTPATYLKNAIAGIPKEKFHNKIIVSAIKGIVPDENLIVGEYLQQHMDIPLESLVVVAGPCHAEEVALERLSYLTLSSSDLDNAACLADLLETRYLNTRVSEDVIGTEYAAVLKNIYAVACGICHGIGYGDNFQAVLVSNALREMKNFIDMVLPLERDLMQSAYLGDLLVTAYSNFSRNRTFGNMIGKGYSVKAAQLEMNMVAEGYYASQCVKDVCCRFNIEIPICEAVYQILHQGKNPSMTMRGLAEKLM